MSPKLPPEYLWGRDQLGLDQTNSIDTLKPVKVDLEELKKLSEKTSHLFSEHGNPEKITGAEASPA